MFDIFRGGLISFERFISDELIRDRLVCGIRDDEVRNESKLTLESCITMVKSAVATASQKKSDSANKNSAQVCYRASYCSYSCRGYTVNGLSPSW